MDYRDDPTFCLHCILSREMTRALNEQRKKHGEYRMEVVELAGVLGLIMRDALEGFQERNSEAATLREFELAIQAFAKGCGGEVAAMSRQGDYAEKWDTAHSQEAASKGKLH